MPRGTGFDDDRYLEEQTAAKEAQERGKGYQGIFCGAAIELAEGTVVTGKDSPLMHAPSALVLNAAKRLAGVPNQMHLLPPSMVGSISHLKGDVLSGNVVCLDLGETLIALSISATANPAAEMAPWRLQELRSCEVHLTHMPAPGDAAGLRSLGVNLTSDPVFSSKPLFIS